MTPALAFLSALLANAILSLGMVLQKRNVLFIGYKGPRDAVFRRHRLGWLLGFTLVNLAPPFNYLALLGIPANVVAGVAGSNVAFAALFSALFLGERLGPRQALYGLLLFLGIGLVGLRGGAPAAASRPLLLWLALLLPLLAALAALAWRRRGRSEGLATLIGGLAGALGGFMLLPLKLLGLETGLGAWLSAPWLWLYLVAGLASFSIVQLAYKDGSMRRVAPAYYGLQVLWPALSALFVFGLTFDALQLLGLAIIGLCVVLIAGGGD